MKKRLKLVLLTAEIMALACTGCGKKDKSTKVTTKATESSIVQTDTNDEDMKEDDTDETSKDNKKDSGDDNLVRYTKQEVYYDFPMTHEYDELYSHINDTDEIFVAMSTNMSDKYELEDILEKHREKLGKDILYVHAEDMTYNIESQENYTTKNGIEGIKYEGTLVENEDSAWKFGVPIWFYCFCFNGEKYSYQFIGFSSKQITYADDGTYDLEATKAQIKDMMDKSIDTITIEQ